MKLKKNISKTFLDVSKSLHFYNHLLYMSSVYSGKHFFCDAFAYIRRASSAADLIPHSLAKSIKGVFAVFVCLTQFFENSCYTSIYHDILASWSEIKETENMERKIDFKGQHFTKFHVWNKIMHTAKMTDLFQSVYHL